MGGGATADLLRALPHRQIEMTFVPSTRAPWQKYELSRVQHAVNEFAFSGLEHPLVSDSLCVFRQFPPSEPSWLLCSGCCLELQTISYGHTISQIRCRTRRSGDMALNVAVSCFPANAPLLDCEENESGWNVGFKILSLF